MVDWAEMYASVLCNMLFRTGSAVHGNMDHCFHRPLWH